jgi:hypothetical protein
MEFNFISEYKKTQRERKKMKNMRKRSEKHLKKERKRKTWTTRLFPSSTNHQSDN